MCMHLLNIHTLASNSVPKREMAHYWWNDWSSATETSSEQPAGTATKADGRGGHIT